MMNDLMSQYEKQYGLPTGLLNAVSSVESAGNQNAVSPKGAQGQFQIMPATAQELGVDPMNPASAVDGAARYLRQNYDKFGTWDLALAAYNAGPGAVQKHGGVPPYKETQDYIQRINNRMAQVPTQTTQQSGWRSRATPVGRSVQQPVQATPTQNDWKARAKVLKAPEEKGILSRIGDNVDTRINQMGESAQAYVEGQQTMGETVAQNALQGGAVFSDTLGEVASSVTPDFVKDIGKSLITNVGKLPVPMSDHGDTLATAVPNELGMIAEKLGPRTMRNLEAVGNALTLVPAGKAAASVGNLAGTAGRKAIASKGIQNFLKDETSGRPIKPPKPTPTAAPTTADIKNFTTQAYDEASYLGANFTPEQLGNKIDDAIEKLKPKPLANGKLTTEDIQLIKEVDELAGHKGKAMSLAEMQRLDESITQKINKYVDKQTGQLDNTGRKLYLLQKELRREVDAVDAAGNDALINGRNFYKAQMALRDLDAIAERASMTQNPATSLQVGYRNLYMDKDRIAGWPVEAKELLKKAATPGVKEEVLSVVGSRLPALIGLGAGNIPGAATAQIAGMMARSARESIVAGRGAKVQESIIRNAMANQRKVDIPPLEPTPIHQRLLAAPGKLSPLPMSTTQVKIAQAKMSVKPPSPTSGSATIPAVDRTANVEGYLSKTKLRNIDKLSKMLRAGDISQNEFVKDVKKSTGLSEAKVRQLARELMVKRGIQIPRPEPK